MNNNSKNIKTKRTYELYRKLDEQLNSNNLINEFRFYKKGDANFKPKKKWKKNPLAEKFFKSFALPVDNGPFGMHDYEFEVITNTLPTVNTSLGINRSTNVGVNRDRVWVSDSGEYWSTNQGKEYGYRYNKNKNNLDILDDPGGNVVLGTVTISSGVAVFKPKVDPAKAKKAQKEKAAQETGGVTKTLDTVQTVIDWAGLIPFIGDALDIINAGISLYRITVRGEDKWVDFFLSLIAFIPIAGSVVSIGLKRAFKASQPLFAKVNKLLKRSGNSHADAIALWDELVESGVLTPELLRKVGPGLEHLEDVLTSSYKPLKKYLPAETADKVIDQLRTLEKWLDTNGKAIDDLADASKRGSDAKKVGIGVDIPNPFTKSIDDIHLKLPILKQVSSFIDKINLPAKLSKTPWYPASKLDSIAKGLGKRFTKNMADPTKFATLLYTMPNKTTLLRQLDNLVSNGITSGNAAFINAALRGGTLQQLAKDPKGLRKFLDTLKTGGPKTADLYTNLVSSSVKHAKNTDSPMWHLFSQSAINNLQVVLSKDIVDASGGFIAGYFKHAKEAFAKRLDLIWNELQDITQDITLASPGEIIYPTNKAAKVRSTPARTTTNIMSTAKMGEPIGQVVGMVDGDGGLWYKVELQSGRVGYVRNDVAAGNDAIDGVLYPIMQKIIKNELTGETVTDIAQWAKKATKEYGIPFVKNVIKVSKEATGIGGQDEYNPATDSGGQYN